MEIKLITVVTLSITQTSAENLVNNSVSNARIVRGLHRVQVILPANDDIVHQVLTLDLRVPKDLTKLSDLLTGLNTDRHTEIVHQK